MILTIAMDGPVGAGKSTVANDVAKELGILHLDTGAMYRALGLLAMRENVKLDDEDALVALIARATPAVRFEGGAQQTWIDGQDVTGLIRTQEVGTAASAIAKVAGVRKAMVACQQALAQKQSMLLDGRDIGTRVLPNATIKIYLTATPEARAQRRFEELQKKNIPADYDEILHEVMRRDEQDMNREVDPLRPAEDAQILDTTEMTQAQVKEDILRRVRMKLGQNPKREEALSPLYKVARFLAPILFSVLMPVTYHHVENAQLDAPYILIADHNSMMDPIAVGWKCYRYQIRFLGKKELEKSRLGKWLFNGLRMIPVDRHNMDMAALRACMKTLADGHPLGIFPEGTRYKAGVMENLETGVAMIALRSGAKLLPAYISAAPRPFRRVHIYYGQPISVTEIAKKGISKETCDELLTLIRDTYQRMVQLHEDSKARP